MQEAEEVVEVVEVVEGAERAMGLQLDSDELVESGAPDASELCSLVPSGPFCHTFGTFLA